MKHELDDDILWVHDQLITFHDVCNDHEMMISVSVGLSHKASDDVSLLLHIANTVPFGADKTIAKYNNVLQIESNQSQPWYCNNGKSLFAFTLFLSENVNVNQRIHNKGSYKGLHRKTIATISLAINLNLCSWPMDYDRKHQLGIDVSQGFSVL